MRWLVASIFVLLLVPTALACNGVCEPDARQCADGGFQVCVNITDTCDTEWNTTEACPSGEICLEDGVCEPEPLTLDNTLANYALFLMEEAQGDYVIECGAADVLNSQLYLPEISGYPSPPAVCVLDADGKKATMFAMDSSTDPSDVINHFLEYSDQGASNTNIIKSVDASACASSEMNDAGWNECPGAIAKSKYHVYYQLDEPTTYLVTYDFKPEFAQNFVEKIIGFFTGLFVQEDIPEHLEAFSRGYFAYVTSGGESRTINAIYESDGPHELGDATITYKDFKFNVAEMAPQAEYSLASDYRQVLYFKDITPATWKKLTAGLRVDPSQGDGSRVGKATTCQDNVLDYAEDCDGTAAWRDNIENCSQIPESNYINGTLACDTDTCFFDTSGCYSCDDYDPENPDEYPGLYAACDTSCGQEPCDCPIDGECTCSGDACDVCTGADCPVEECNSDGVCADPETTQNCAADCENTCPASPVRFAKQGGYYFDVEIDSNGIPQLIVMYDGDRKTGDDNNKYCDWDAKDKNYEGEPHQIPLFEGKQIYYTTGHNNWGKVTVQPIADGWDVIYHQSESDTKSEKCWGDAGFALAGKDPVILLTVNPFDTVSCENIACRTNGDCTGINQACVVLQPNKISTCQQLPPNYTPPPSGSGGGSSSTIGGSYSYDQFWLLADK